MDQELETLIRERFQMLPDNLKKAIAALPLLDIMQDIATKNGLHIDQSGDLYAETLLIMLGTKKISDFEKNLRETLGIDAGTAKNIEIAVNEKVFLPVRETLKQFQDIQEKAEAEAAEAPAETMAPADEPIGSREELLAEIEGHANAPKTAGGVGSVPATMPGPIAGEKLLPDPANDPTAIDFVTQKLTQTVSEPTRTATVEPAKVADTAKPTQNQPKPPAQPKSYANDPYREPLA